jgi:hypothetical protein
MRKLLIGAVLILVAGGAAYASSPYQVERIATATRNNTTGCEIEAARDSGWKPGPRVWGFRNDRLEEPVHASIAIYNCPDLPGGRPVAMILIAADGTRVSGDCGNDIGPGFCPLALPAVPAAGGAALRYRVLIHRRAGEAFQSLDLDVRRDKSWRSGTLDAILTV